VQDGGTRPTRRSGGEGLGQVRVEVSDGDEPGWGREEGGWSLRARRE
jgi:hypothetical protein